MSIISSPTVPIPLSYVSVHFFDSSRIDYLFPIFQSAVEVVKDTYDSFERRLFWGCGGVAIMWHKSLNPLVSVIPFPLNEMIVGTRLSSSPVVSLFSCYLLTRSGGINPFKSVMHELDSCFNIYPSDVLLFAGDFNTDPELSVGSFHRPPNEQGIILQRYLRQWGYVSFPVLSKFQPPSLANAYM